MKKPIPFGKYVLLERVNVGGMAEVFKAKAFGVEGFERLVAVKRILPSIAEDQEFITMFIDEAKIAVQLAHANIAQIFDLGRAAGSYFIAMEYVHGKDMRAIFDRARQRGETIPVPMACYVTMKVCEGLDYAHNKKDAAGRDLHLVHRDVSPQNILISYDGEVKLIDFGVAKAANKAGKTQAGILKGKFGYMSPEQVRGLPVDRRSDLFAMGVTLYELLTGERLFVAESDFSTLEKVRNVEIMPPSTYNRRIPEELEQIVLKALAREPEDRYQTAMDLHDDLQSFMYTSGNFFARKDLSNQMRRVFADEIARESQREEEYREMEAEISDSQVESVDNIAGPAAPAANASPARASAPPPLGAVRAPASSVPPPPPPRPSGAPPAGASTGPALDMDWDDEELATQIYDKPHEAEAAAQRASGGPAPSAPAPSAPAPAGRPGSPAFAAAPSLPSSEPPRAEPPRSSAPRAGSASAGGPGVSAPPSGAPAPWNTKTPPPPSPPPSAPVSAPPSGPPVAPARAPASQGEAGPTQPDSPAFPREVPPPSRSGRKGEPTEVTSRPRERRSGVGLPPILIAGGIVLAALLVGAAIFFRPQPGTLTLKTEPARAEVLVDGEEVSGSSPFVNIELEPGEDHNLRVSAEGFETWSDTIQVQAGQERELRVDLTPKHGASAGATLADIEGTGFTLDTKPRGATVLVDGEELRDETPVEVTDLSPGTHTLRVTHGSRYDTWQTEIEVAEGEVIKLPRAVLRLRKVAVAFDSKPSGAEVVLRRGRERRNLGETPTHAEIDVTGDAWSVKMSKDGFESWSRELKVPSGREELQIEADLERAERPARRTARRRPARRSPSSSASSASAGSASPSSASASSASGAKATLRVNSRPWSQVHVDGRMIGNTPQMSISLPAGTHQLTLVNPDFGLRKTVSVTLSPGETKTKIVNLTE